MDNFIFDEETHTYFLNGKPVPSVTQILEQVLFKDKYIGIDEEILKKASEYGKLIHSEVQSWIERQEIGITKEQANFIKLCKDLNIICEASEKQVHNDEVAGTIDIIASNGKKEILIDVKTTAELDREYVSWQLSFYNYILNDEIDRDLYALWLRDDKCKLVQVEKKSNEQIKEVIQAYNEGRTLEIKTSLQTIPQEKQITFINMLKQMKELEDKTKEIKEAILKEMENRNIASIRLEDVLISYKAPYIQKSVDSSKLKEDGIYDKYVKKSIVKGSISIKIGGKQ